MEENKKQWWEDVKKFPSNRIQLINTTVVPLPCSKYKTWGSSFRKKNTNKYVIN